jgi:membrane protease subunit (stomatin/prohibitin family)
MGMGMGMGMGMSMGMSQAVRRAWALHALHDACMHARGNDRGRARRRWR